MRGRNEREKGGTDKEHEKHDVIDPLHHPDRVVVPGVVVIEHRVERHAKADEDDAEHEEERKHVLGHLGDDEEERTQHPVEGEHIDKPPVEEDCVDSECRPDDVFRLFVVIRAATTATTKSQSVLWGCRGKTSSAG